MQKKSQLRPEKKPPQQSPPAPQKKAPNGLTTMELLELLGRAFFTGVRGKEVDPDKIHRNMRRRRRGLPPLPEEQTSWWKTIKRKIL